MNYHVQVNTYGDPAGVYTGNAVVHETVCDAVRAASDLFGRWTAVKFWRVIDDQGAVMASNSDTEKTS